MAGLTREGFVPLTLDEIRSRIQTRLEAFNSGFDFTIDSPDGQLIEIMSFELSQAWQELGMVYDSYDPDVAVGAALRNLGAISGLPYGSATRSTAQVNLVGVSGTVVPRNAVVTDADGNEFMTQAVALIPSSVQVISKLSGNIPVLVGSISNIDTAVTGWTSVTQTSAGIMGNTAQTETQFRNARNKAVLRNFVGIEATMIARLTELGVSQIVVSNNNTNIAFDDGTPAQSIQVTIGEIGSVSEVDIARTILGTKGFGTPTYGASSRSVADLQNNYHTINYTIATPVNIFVNLNLTYLSSEIAGASDSIKQDLVAYINSLVTGEDVIWSRLFGIVTPYGKAQINSLELSTDGSSYSSGNIAIESTEYANITVGQIGITVV